MIVVLVSRQDYNGYLVVLDTFIINLAKYQHSIPLKITYFTNMINLNAQYDLKIIYLILSTLFREVTGIQNGMK